MTPRTRANLMLLTAALIWGTAFVAQRVGAEAMPPAGFTAVRHLLGALVLVPAVVWFDRRRGVGPAEGARLWRTGLVPGAVIGVALFGGSYLQQFGLEYTTAGNAGFITSLYMVLVPLAGWLVLGHRPSRWVWLGVALTTVGLYLLSVRDGFAMNPGDLLVMGCAMAWTVQILLVDRYASALDPLRLAATEFAVCGVVATVVALVTEHEPFAGTLAAAVPLLYAALLSTGVAFTLQVLAQRDTEPSTAALIFALEAVFAAIAGALLLGERMDARALLGCALMLTGIVLAQRSPGAHPVPTAGEHAPVADPESVPEPHHYG